MTGDGPARALGQALGQLRWFLTYLAKGEMGMRFTDLRANWEDARVADMVRQLEEEEGKRRARAERERERQELRRALRHPKVAVRRGSFQGE